MGERYTHGHVFDFHKQLLEHPDHLQVGLDFSEETVSSLRAGKAPLFEPGLDDLIRDGLHQRALSFETDPEAICQDADILWVAYDTPVDDNDRADLAPILKGIARCHPYLSERAIILISSQIPAGTCRSLELITPGAVSRIPQRIFVSDERLKSS